MEYADWFVAVVLAFWNRFRPRCYIPLCRRCKSSHTRTIRSEMKMRIGKRGSVGASSDIGDGPASPYTRDIELEISTVTTTKIVIQD